MGGDREVFGYLGCGVVGGVGWGRTPGWGRGERGRVRVYIDKIRCSKCLVTKLIDRICAAHNADLERIAAGMPKAKVSIRSSIGANIQLKADQAHVRRFNAND